MKWWMCTCTRDTSATRKTAEAFSGGLISAYYSNNTSAGSIYDRTQKNFVLRLGDLDDQKDRMVEN
jgi:hypothetical protein